MWSEYIGKNSLRSGCREPTSWDTKVHLQGSTVFVSIDLLIMAHIEYVLVKQSEVACSSDRAVD